MDTKPRAMITFKEGDIRFTYRIGGIVLHDNHVLFQKATENTHEVFYFLPGGRAELLEHATDSLKREMVEELNAVPTVERLLYVVENFFVDPTPHHEVGLYFLMTFPPDTYLYKEPGPFVYPDEVKPDFPLIFEWLPLDHLPSLPLQPKFLRTALRAIPDQPTHVVNVDE